METDELKKLYLILFVLDILYISCCINTHNYVDLGKNILYLFVEIFVYFKILS